MDGIYTRIFQELPVFGRDPFDPKKASDTMGLINLRIANPVNLHRSYTPDRLQMDAAESPRRLVIRCPEFSFSIDALIALNLNRVNGPARF